MAKKEKKMKKEKKVKDDLVTVFSIEDDSADAADNGGTSGHPDPDKEEK